MKTMTKKLGAIVLALAMCFSFCCTALAANSTDTQGSITITNAQKGEIYSIYKIFDLTYDETSDAYSYKVVSDWTSFISGYEYEEGEKLFTLDTNGYLDPDSAIYDQKDDSAVMSAFAQAALAYAVEAEITASDTKTADDTTVEFTGLDLGYYLVDTSLGTLCSLTTAVPNATAEEKNTPPDVTKEVDEKEEESVENNKTVEYELDIDHIKGVSDLVLHDKMDINNTQTTVTYEFDFSTVTVTLYANADDCANKVNGTTLNAGTDYTLVTEGPYADGKSDTCDFHIVFNYDFSNCTTESIIEVTIKCELNAEGAVFGDDEFTLPNFAMVTYGNDGSSEWKEADVYEFGFKVYKYTENDDVKTALQGVTFELKNGTDESATSAWFEEETVNGQTVYLFEGWTQPEAKEGATYTQTLTTDSDGMLYIEGVDASTYYLYETSTLDGYNPLTGPITVTIEAVYDETTGKLVSHKVSYTYETTTVDEATNHQVDVENNTGSELPTTGGIGTTIFYIIGGVLVAGAVVVLVTRRRMSHEA